MEVMFNGYPCIVQEAAMVLLRDGERWVNKWESLVLMEKQFFDMRFLRFSPFRRC